MHKSILAAIDLAVSSDQVLAATREYAKAFSAKVYLVHVTQREPTPEHATIDLSMLSDPISGPDLPINVDRQEEADRLRAEHRTLQDLRKNLSDEGIDATALTIEGATVEKLLLEIERLDIDLVIMAPHAPGFFRDIFIGSTTKEVIRDAPCPILVLPPKWDKQGPIRDQSR